MIEILEGTFRERNLLEEILIGTKTAPEFALRINLTDIKDHLIKSIRQSSYNKKI
jgi:hypothetical protein